MPDVERSPSSSGVRVHGFAASIFEQLPGQDTECSETREEAICDTFGGQVMGAPSRHCGVVFRVGPDRGSESVPGRHLIDDAKAGLEAALEELLQGRFHLGDVGEVAILAKGLQGIDEGGVALAHEE